MPSSTETRDSGDVASRFSHLLQPIRDLTKNWDVDVASHLEEYLSELERIEISFDGGKTSMNFAEAALVIQGSACVYSKKVEYLYTLVYQTLDLIASKKRLQQASSVDEQGQDQDVSLKKDQAEFLDLDDIKEAKNIDLKEDEHTPSSEIVPRTPIALIPLGQEDKQDVLLSRTGEVLGSRNDFKMNTCTVHCSGALLLDITHLSLVDSSFKRTLTLSMHHFTSTQTGTTETPVTENQPDGGDSDFNTPNLGAPDLCDDYDDDVMVEGFDAAHHPESANTAQELIQEGRMALRRREKLAEQQVERLPMRDPWKLLDPYESGTSTQKPFKKGKPFRLPPSMKLANQEKKKKKRKRKSTVKVEPAQLLPIEEFITQAFYTHASKLPKNPLKAPTFLEFEYLYWIEYRRRQEIQKRQKKQLSQILAQEEIEEFNTIVAENQQTGYDAQGDGGDSDDEFGGGSNDNLGGGSNNNFDNEDPICTSVEPMALEEPADNLVVSSYEDLVRHYVEGYLTEAQQYAQETDLSRRVREWEEKILPTLQKEDKHRLFDIHKYGEEIMGSFQGNSKKHFGQVVTGKEPYEICRYFLATLQLANNYNVEICTNGTGENAVDTMAIKLLHKTPAHTAIASYRAPSVIT